MRLFFGLIALFCVVSCSQLPSIDFEKHFRNLKSIRHPLYNKGQNWLEARQYIKNNFLEYGIVNVTTQSFNTSITSIGDKLEYATGVNLIGIIKGTRKDAPIIVVGADYDTPIGGNPYMNNAGGVAIMLETIELFEDRLRWNPYQLDQTVIFVAFDLNTKEYSSASAGKSGSYHFVNEWLPKFLAEYDCTLNAAIILDSVTTFYTNNNTQHLAAGFDKAFPEAHSKIVTNGNKGNFLGFLSLMDQDTNDVRNTFVQTYNRDRKLREYYLQEMPMHLSLDILTGDVVEMINHQAHYHFWTHSDQKFPAFLLFDADDTRYDPEDKDCLGGDCSASTFLTYDRIDFMTHTVDSLFGTLMSLQTSKHDPSESHATRSFSAQYLMITLLACVLLRIQE